MDQEFFTGAMEALAELEDRARQQELAQFDDTIAQLQAMHEDNLRLIAETQRILDSYKDNEQELSRPEARVFTDDEFPKLTRFPE